MVPLLALVGVILSVLISLGTSSSDTHLLRVEKLRPMGRHVLNINRSSIRGWTRVRRSPGGGQQKFPSELKAEGRSRGAADTEAVRWMTRASPAKCGTQSVKYIPPLYNRIPRVRNGTCTPYGAFPWTVQIQVQRNGKYRHLCGGALLSDRHILTAHHCFENVRNLHDVRVMVGQYNMHVRDQEEMAFHVDWVEKHRDYLKDGPHSHDLAMIKLKGKGDGSRFGAQFSRAVAPICLPKAGERFKDDLSCVVSGWGRIEPHGRVHPECMRAAQVPLINQAVCRKMYSQTSQPVIPGQVCAGYPAGGVDACKGDSGGPLACKSRDGTYKLVGVVNWGYACGEVNKPGVFTRVQYYQDWINEKMNGNHL